MTNTTQAHSTHPIALITGGSRGIGRSIALHLAERGVDVILTYVRNEKEAAETVAAIQAKGRKAVALPLDVGHSESFAAFADKVRAALHETFGGTAFHYLVNNAGVSGHASFSETSEAMLDELFRVHFKGPFFLTQKLLPLIADGGRILNITTGLARFSFPGYAAYASMKGGVEVLTRYLAKELAGRKISVNALAPGAIATDFGGGAVRDNAQVNQMVASMTALGRVGEAEDIGRAAAALLSSDAGWINGQRIEVSGGMML